MTVLKHKPHADDLNPLWRPRCDCGWRGKQLCNTEAIALQVAIQHAQDKGCGKKRFTEQSAKQAVLDAKMARGLKRVNRRREERAYQCPDCPGNVWHLTSLPAFSERSA